MRTAYQVGLALNKEVIIGKSFVETSSQTRRPELTSFFRPLLSSLRFHPRRQPRILRRRPQSHRSFRRRSQPTQHLPSPPFLPSRFRSSTQNSPRTLPDRPRQTLLDDRRSTSTSSSGCCSSTAAAAWARIEVLGRRVGKSFALDEQRRNERVFYQWEEGREGVKVRRGWREEEEEGVLEVLGCFQREEIGGWDALLFVFFSLVCLRLFTI